MNFFQFKCLDPLSIIIIMNLKQPLLQQLQLLRQDLKKEMEDEVDLRVGKGYQD